MGYTEHYNYFRDYDASWGRYLESDLIGLSDGTNTYLYVKSGPLGSIDRGGLATFKNFPGDKLGRAKDALEEAKRKLKDCKFEQCERTEDDKNNLIRKMDSATYVYDPTMSDCGFTSYFAIFEVRIGPAAFGLQCCELSSTMAHEANHLRNWGSTGSETASRRLEKACFNCPRSGS